MPYISLLEKSPLLAIVNAKSLGKLLCLQNVPFFDDISVQVPVRTLLTRLTFHYGEWAPTLKYYYGFLIYLHSLFLVSHASMLT